MSFFAPDLTARPPRSVRARLGGYVLLPRMLDKCRAEIAGKNGDYHYNCPLDQRLLAFLDIDAAELKTEVATGKGDGEILDWIAAHQKQPRTPWEIEQWSDFNDRRGPGSDPDALGFFIELLRPIAGKRADISTWAELLDLDDYVSYGGKA